MKSVLFLFSVIFFSLGADAQTTFDEMCTDGSIKTQYGCLERGSCTDGEALLNFNCVAAWPVSTGMQCPARQVLTQFGCIPQGNCPYGQAMYNNTCIPGGYSPYTDPYGYAGQYPNGYYGNNMNNYYWYMYGSNYGAYYMNNQTQIYCTQSYAGCNCFMTGIIDGIAIGVCGR